MSKVKVTNTITVEITAEEKICEDICEKIAEKYPDARMDVSPNGDGVQIDIEVYGEGEFYPGCRTLPNGDPGYPDDWDVEFPIYEEDIEEVVQDYAAQTDTDFDWFIYSTQESDL